MVRFLFKFIKFYQALMISFISSVFIPCRLTEKDFKTQCKYMDFKQFEDLIYKRGSFVIVQSQYPIC